MLFIFTQMYLPLFLNRRYIFYFIKNNLFILFLERGDGKERDISAWLPLTHPQIGTWPATQACALTGN